MKTNTEIEQVTQLLRDENYPTLLKRLIEKLYRVELCEHLCVQPCRQCFVDVDNPILTHWEDL
jgi:hypothetical protein